VIYRKLVIDKLKGGGRITRYEERINNGWIEEIMKEIF